MLRNDLLVKRKWKDMSIKNKLNKISVDYGMNKDLLEGVHKRCYNYISYIDLVKILRKIDTNRRKVVHEFELEKNYLVNDTIDNIIEYLKDLKEKGYDSIGEEWSGYEDNYFVAYKHDDEETDEEYYKRLAHEADNLYDDIKNNLKKKEEKINELNKLKGQIKNIENELLNYEIENT